MRGRPRARPEQERSGSVATNRRLLIVTQWFPPEQAPFGRMMLELATDLADRGWNVTVVTGFPNHPQGTVFPGYRKRWVARETIGRVNVLRVWLATSPRRSLLNRLLTFATFTLTSTWAALRAPRGGVLFAVMQPLSMALTLPIVARLKGMRLVFNVQDLHPDTQIRLGMIRNPLLISTLRGIERRGYRRADCVTVICEAFREHVVDAGGARSKVSIVENWIDIDEIVPAARDNAFRREAGCSPEDFVVLWAGTLGHVSGAATLLDAAALLRDAPVRFVFVGDGPIRETLRARAQSEGLTHVAFMPFQPRERLTEVQACADLSVVTLAAEFADLSVPSKVLAYLAAARPVLAAVPAQSATARYIAAAEAGFLVPPGDAPAIVATIRRLAAARGEARTAGERGRAYVVRNSSRVPAAERYARVLADCMDVSA
jgi:colanic acid biosynthesis glycosyl transferase WcaI